MVVVLVVWPFVIGKLHTKREGKYVLKDLISLLWIADVQIGRVIINTSKSSARPRGDLRTKLFWEQSSSCCGQKIKWHAGGRQHIVFENTSSKNLCPTPKVPGTGFTLDHSIDV